MFNANYPFGYCTNVHAGTNLEDAKANLLAFSSDVRARVIPDGNLPVGLWLAENAATTLIEQSEVLPFRNWLGEHNFLPYTFNGFPQGDFHQPVVKHAVYEPTWTCDSRTRYTLCLAEILAAIMPEGSVGSISTLPLGWPHAPWHAENYKVAADNLLGVAKFLARLEENTGREIVLALEPEPGCVLDTAPDLVEFFEHYLLSGSDVHAARRHLTVCHDICHSGVMFEPQREALESYRAAGLRIGKVQVSSAVHVPWDEAVGDPEHQTNLLTQLQTLNEPKYLHQTTRCDRSGRRTGLCEDLPQALEKWISMGEFPSDPWRIHFHVPIFVNEFGSLQTTREDIHAATEFIEAHHNETVEGKSWFTGHYEVETYAWPVLPAPLATDCLASGIVRELNYFSDILDGVIMH